MTLNDLATMLADRTLNHTAYRNHDTLWEGLWIYANSNTRARYTPAGVFYADDSDLDAALELVRNTGINA